jgi:hypothetical protein
MSCVLPHNSAWYLERWTEIEDQLAETHKLIGLSRAENGADELELADYAKQLRTQAKDYKNKYSLAKKCEDGTSKTQKLNSYQFGTMG